MTTAADTVWVLTGQTDPTADLVVEELLQREVPVVRFDTADFPTTLSLTASLERRGWSGRMVTSNQAAAVDRVGAIYYSRSAGFRTASGLPASARRFASAQSRAGFIGTVGALPCRWVNHPSREAGVRYKPWQLAVARDVGLNPPRTLITTHADAARAFVAAAPGPVVAKSLVGGGVPTIVDPHGLDDSVRMCAHLFQHWLDRSHDIHVVVVGAALYAVEVHTGDRDGSAHPPYERVGPPATFRVVNPPDDVRDGIVRLTRRFGLLCCSVDLIVTPDGQWRFIGLTANGQWARLQHETGLPIAAGVADLLDPGLDPMTATVRR